VGICNGFQVLARLGVLGNVSLAPNDSGQFECRWVRLRVEPSNCPFLQGLESLDLSIAHGQGRVVAPEEDLGHILQQAPLRYCENPNGSVADIAGVCNPAGNVLGLMPHPERYLTPQHHPNWSRRADLPPLGLTIFQNAIRYVEAL
jgi:phosphoribosylformylglycinamidine synthase